MSLKKYFSSFFHFIGSVILASAVAGYWYVAGDMALETASEVFVGVFLAASPLPFILSRRLIALRIKRCLKASAVTCGRTAALTELMRVSSPRA